MTTRQHLNKSAFILSVLFVVLFGLSSCGNKSMDNTEVSVAQIKPAANPTKEHDERFLVRAAEMNFEEILRGKLAFKRATSEEVKELGRLLEEANRNAKSTLTGMGYKKSIMIPSAPNQVAHAAYDILNKATVEEFDAAYINLVIEGHNNAISHFENAVSGNIDPDIKALAQTMLPEIRNHLSKAMDLNARLNPVSEVVTAGN